MNDKIVSLLGFAVKADKLIYGLDELKQGTRKRYLIICCHSLSERGKKEVLYVAERDNVPLIEVKTQRLEDVIHKTDCKVVGLKNKSMAEAIIKYLTNDYLLLRSEEKN